MAWRAHIFLVAVFLIIEQHANTPTPPTTIEASEYRNGLLWLYWRRSEYELFDWITITLCFCVTVDGRTWNQSDRDELCPPQICIMEMRSLPPLTCDRLLVTWHFANNTARWIIYQTRTFQKLRRHTFDVAERWIYFSSHRASNLHNNYTSGFYISLKYTSIPLLSLEYTRILFISLRFTRILVWSCKYQRWLRKH